MPEVLTAIPSTPYDAAFYQHQQDGSLQSAREIVPHIIQLAAPASVVDVGCGVGAWPLLEAVKARTTNASATALLKRRLRTIDIDNLSRKTRGLPERDVELNPQLCDECE